jgi:uncharacterized membrane protein
MGAAREFSPKPGRTKNMLASFLMGLVGGQRSMAPIAAVSFAASHGLLPPDNGAAKILAHRLVSVGAIGLAIGEIVVDKLKTAPNRTAPIGLAARFLSSAIAGAALAPRQQRWLGAAVGGSTAVAAAYAGLQIRTACMRHHSQASTGLIEDGAVLLGVIAILGMASGKARR